MIGANSRQPAPVGLRPGSKQGGKVEPLAKPGGSFRWDWARTDLLTMLSNAGF
jgi:hypothetical protein